jgi:hypothetical protein
MRTNEVWQIEIQRRHRYLIHEMDETSSKPFLDAKYLKSSGSNAEAEFGLNKKREGSSQHSTSGETEKKLRIPQSKQLKRLKIQRNCNASFQESSKLSIFISLGRLENVKAYQKKRTH